ncbi:MAG: site-2 protease family protein [Fimbriimonadaceae bacterium]|nr:site-2 protease family protein [Fimbriimonadaceae bacterium]
MTPVEQLVNVVRGGVAFVLVLTVLVAVHELGHYLAARMYGMKVDAFAVFLGGLRQTDLTGHLPWPLRPARAVWAVGAAGLAVAVVGSFLSNVSLTVAGLAVVGLVVPVWVARRLEFLYHMGPGGGVRRVAIGAGVLGFAVVMFSRGSMPTTGPDAAKSWLLTVLAAAALGAWCGVMSTYWAPTFLRTQDPTGDPAQDEAMGHGAVSVGDGMVPVRFRPVWSKTLKNGAELALNILPLGGFVKIHGAHPRDDGSEVDIPGGQFSKGPFARFVVFAAGPAFSLLLGVFLIWVGLVGQGKPGPASRVTDAVQHGSPADKAGIKPGDVFVAVNGKPVDEAKQAMEAIRYSYEEQGGKLVGQPVRVTVERGSRSLDITVVPMVSPQAEDIPDSEGKIVDHRHVARIGVVFRPTYVPVHAGEALVTAAAAPVEAVVGMLKLRTVNEFKDNVGGIGTVAAVTTSAAQSGFWPVVKLAGLLSISLGMMNLLPIVPLDGGQMAVAFIEMFRGGKRISPALQSLVTNVGTLLIFLLALTVLSVDMGRIVGGPSTPPVAAPKK